VADGKRAFLGVALRISTLVPPEKYEYPINRYAMEVKRQLDVLGPSTQGQ